jgi:hypothetical protein
VETRVGARGSLCEIGGGQNGTGFSPISSVFPVSIIPPCLSMVIYHLGDEQWARRSSEMCAHTIDMNNMLQSIKFRREGLKICAIFKDERDVKIKIYKTVVVSVVLCTEELGFSP